jgi:hypothetical protein
MFKNAPLSALLICSISLFSACSKSKKKTESKQSAAPAQPTKKDANAAVTPSAPKKLQRPPSPPIRGKVVDKIICRVNGTNIMLSDLHEPRIDKNGDVYTLDEAIAEELLFQKASELKLIPTDVEIERRIVAIKQANGLLKKTEDDFDSWLRAEARLTQRKFKRQLVRTGAASHVKGWNANESSVVSEKEKRDFFASNTIMSQERYHLKTAFIEEDNIDENGSVINADDVTWTDIGWVEKDELSAPMSFVSGMKKDEISKPVKTEYGYSMVQLIDTEPVRKKTYEESEVQIEKKLIRRKQKRGDQLLINKLRKRASIVMLS